MVGPNDAFIRYIGEVLPSLGEIDGDQVAVQELVERPKVDVRATDEDAAAALKHDARMATLIRRVAEDCMGVATDPVVVRVGTTPVRAEPRELDRIRARVLGRRLPYEAGRVAFRNLVVEHLLASAETMVANVTNSHVSQAMRASKQAMETLDALWPKLDPVDLVVRLLGERRVLADAAGSLFTAGEQDLLVWPRRATRGRAPWTAADLLLIDEAAGFIERPPGYGHVVVDEAQDLSPMQLRAIGRRRRQSLTVLGDLAQATTPWASEDWGQTLRHLSVGDAQVQTLSRAFRIQGSVLELANRLLPAIAPALTPTIAVRDAPDALHFVAATPGAVTAVVAEQVSGSLERPGSIGVIAPASRTAAIGDLLSGAGIDWSGVGEMAAGHRVTLLEAPDSKGLEFDVVVLVEPEILAASGDPKTLRLLYIAMTRAVLRLVVVHSGPLPAALAGTDP